LGLLWLVPKATRGSPRRSRVLVLAGIVAGLSLVGLVLKVVPAFYQVNSEIIALALPIHLGVAVGVRQLIRSRSTPKMG
ncbi:MAG: hypothetical protein M3Q75_10555, partial [Gemmatimonadota bacterium]|nr:hypothetical protein [Gemmatimonadota bacterium]